MAVEPWRFEQLGGNHEILILSGYAAPFGRPRQDPVSITEMNLRQKKSRAPGSDAVSRQIYGWDFEPVQLRGRWMDHALGGPGAALAKKQEVKAFVKAALPVAVTWGTAFGCIGMLSNLVIRDESQHQCAWSMTLDFDEDMDTPARPVPPPKQPKQYAQNLRAVFGLFKDVTKPTISGEPDRFRPRMKLGFVDSLETLVSQLLTPVAELEAVATEMKSLKDGTIGQIRKFRAGLTMFQRTARALVETFENNPNSGSLEVESAREQLALQMAQAEIGAAIAMALADVAEADREARQAMRLKIKDIVVARQGDTWESLSLAIYGDMSRAQALSEANDMGVEPPFPGETYIAPL